MRHYIYLAVVTWKTENYFGCRYRPRPCKYESLGTEVTLPRMYTIRTVATKKPITTVAKMYL